MSRHRFSWSKISFLMCLRFSATCLSQNSRWPPIWPPQDRTGHISATNKDRRLVLVYKHSFSWSKISFLMCLTFSVTWLPQNSRWLPKWPPHNRNSHISASNIDRRLILVSSHRFSWSKISFLMCLRFSAT
mgnify:CR=1 FL=1